MLQGLFWGIMYLGVQTKPGSGSELFRELNPDPYQSFFKILIRNPASTDQWILYQLSDEDPSNMKNGLKRFHLTKKISKLIFKKFFYIMSPKLRINSFLLIKTLRFLTE